MDTPEYKTAMLNQILFSEQAMFRQWKFSLETHQVLKDLKTPLQGSYATASRPRHHGPCCVTSSSFKLQASSCCSTGTVALPQ